MTLRGNRRRAQTWPNPDQQPDDISGLLAGNPLLTAVAEGRFGITQSTQTPRRAICAQLCPAAKIALAQSQAEQSRKDGKERP